MATPTLGAQTKMIDIPFDHPSFTGHFPGRPIVPGVVLLDLALAALSEDLGLATGPVQVRNTKFLAPVGPGAHLELRFVFDTRGGVNFTFSEAGNPVASGGLSFEPAP
jgi:3-hydroxymyristoyl/3-hydroxydecanoyl-(acyl carrier protein) dehydratase